MWVSERFFFMLGKIQSLEVYQRNQDIIAKSGHMWPIAQFIGNEAEGPGGWKVAAMKTR